MSFSGICADLIRLRLRCVRTQPRSEPWRSKILASTSSGRPWIERRVGHVVECTAGALSFDKRSHNLNDSRGFEV